MYMQKLADTLYKLVFKQFSPIIQLYVDNKREWSAIESKIHKWFERYDVLSYCIGLAEDFDKRGEIFYDESGTVISIDDVVSKLREVKIDVAIEEDVVSHYGNIVPTIKFLECSGDSKSFVEVFKNGQIGRMGCTDPSRENHL